MIKEQLNYTFILHQIRKKLKLSLIEYCIADSIYHLSNNPQSKIQGWCFASKEHIAEFLGVNSSTIFSNLNKIIKKRLVEKDKDTKYLRTTQKWYENVVLIKMKEEYGKIQYPIGKSNSKVLDNPIVDYWKVQYNNNKYNNKDNIGSKTAHTPFFQENKKEIHSFFDGKKVQQNGVDIFDWQWVIRNAEKDPRLYYISLYWKQKDYSFENKTEARDEIVRLIRKAGVYSKKYKLKQFQEMLEWIDENSIKKGGYTWTFETLDKKLAEFYKDNKPQII